MSTTGVESTDEESQQSSSKVVWLFLTIVGLTVIYPHLMACIYGFKSADSLAEFGDQFGGLNALMSALGLCALLYTIQLQRKELAMQREDLRLQRKEMKESRRELAKQAEAQESYVAATNRAAEINGIGLAVTAIQQSQSSPTPIDSRETVKSLYDRLKELLAIESEPSQRGRSFVIPPRSTS